MTRRTRTRGAVRWAVPGILSMLGFVACGGLPGAARAPTMPPDFRYLPAEEIRSVMWVLAAEVESLDRLLDGAGDADSPARREAVVASLTRMQVAARGLESGGRATQHPGMALDLERLVARLEHARRAALRDPPQYFLAGSVVGACAICHGGTRAAASSGPRLATLAPRAGRR